MCSLVGQCVCELALCGCAWVGGCVFLYNVSGAELYAFVRVTLCIRLCACTRCACAIACVYLHGCVCRGVCVFVSVLNRAHLCVSITHTHTGEHTVACIQVYLQCECVRTPVLVSAPVCLCLNASVFMFVRIRAYTCVCVCVCVYPCN